MNKRDWKIKVLMAGMAVFLTGCGSDFPDMTQEEEQMVGEYAANVLLKYDANNRSRLVSREIVAEDYVRREQMEEAVIPEATQTMDPVEDTPVTEIGQETADGFRTGSLEEFYNLPEGVSITYQGNEICNSYFQDGENSEYLALDATEGKALLVMKFIIDNQSPSEQMVDLLSHNVIIRVTMNESSKYNVLTTLLMNDMSTYAGMIPAGASAETVLLFEIDEAESNAVTSLSLQLKEEDRTCAIQLQ